MSLERVFEDVRRWQHKTFPKATAKSATHHLSREARELLLDMEHEKSLEDVASELADVIILSVGIADQLGVDIERIVGEKLEINKKRVWGKPDSQGVVEHVRTEDRPVTVSKNWPSISKLRMDLDGKLPG